MRAILILTALATAPAWAAEEKLDEAQAVGVLLSANAAEMPIATSMAARSDDPEVRAYASMLLKDHAKANDELLGLLDDQNLRARDSDLREDKVEKAGKALDAYWDKDVGPTLDQRFLTDAIVEHRKLLEAFDETLMPAATNPAVKQAFERQRASVERHLKEACTIGERLEAQTAGCPEAERGTR